MTKPRRDKMNPDVMEVHHNWSRCVQRAFLMGVDPLTGRDVSYRREWLASLTEYLVSVFAVEVATDNMLGNHFHQLVRNRPDVAKQWSDEEVCWRWKMAWPQFDKPVWRCEPTDESIDAMLLRAQNEEGYLEGIRRNLHNISWFQARLKQHVLVCT